MRINRNIMIVAAFAAAAITITSCSQDEMVGERHSDGAIGFAPLLKGATSTTRMVDADHSYGTVGSVKLPNNFDVWAFTSKDNMTAGKVLYMGMKDDGIKIKKASETDDHTGLGWSHKDANNFYWGYENQGEVTYWPLDTLRFYAISPAFDTVNGYSATPSDPIIFDPVFLDGDAKAYFSAKVTDNNMDDILIAVKNQKATISGSSSDYAVPLVFRHALAKVTFKGQLNPVVNQNMRVEIRSMEITNVLSRGACSIDFDASNSDYHSPTGVIKWGSLTEASSVYTFTPNTYTTTPAASGTNYLSTYATYALDGADKKIGADPTDATATSVTEGEGDNAKTFYKTVDFGSIVVLPQYITAWAGSDSNLAALNDNTTSPVTNHGTFIKITYDLVSQRGVTILDAGKVAYVPVTSTLWEAGKHYTYTLLFGLGVKENGDPMGAPITFTVDSVTDWNTTGTASDITLGN